MKKFLFIIFMVLTLGLVLVPKCFAFSGFGGAVLDNANRLTSIVRTTSPTAQYELHFDTTGLDSNSTYYVNFQIFKYDNTNVPLRWSSITSYTSPTIRINGSQNNMSEYTTNNNFGWRSSTWYIPSAYDYILITPGVAGFIDNYVFNITMVRGTSNGFIGSFIPNSYYAVGGFSSYGYFSNVNVYTLVSGTQNVPVNRNDIMINYNIIRANSMLDEFYNTNNASSQGNYYIRVEFIGGSNISQMPNLSIKYLECLRININNTSYTYSNAISNYSWLYNNIVLYNDNATLFTGDTTGFNDVIYSIDFRIADYTFKSSSYYSSSIGLKGYLSSFYITPMDNTTLYDYNIGYDNGYRVGYENGDKNGYNRGTTDTHSGFDNLMLSIADVPMGIISSMLNFEILGVNLLGFFMGIITLMLFVFLMRKFKE